MTKEHLRIATEEWNNSPKGVPLNALCIDLLKGSACQEGDGQQISQKTSRCLEIHIELLDTPSTMQGKCALSQVLITPEFLGK
jgi:hypothetical protein